MGKKRASLKKVVAPELRGFVAEALGRKLLWPPDLPLSQVMDLLNESGEAHIQVTGSDGDNTLPFEFNINARGGPKSPEIFKKVFSASLKFGSMKIRRSKVCVAKIDGAHGSPHLHMYSPEEGRCAEFTERGGNVSLEWYNLRRYLRRWRWLVLSF